MIIFILSISSKILISRQAWCFKTLSRVKSATSDGWAKTWQISTSFVPSSPSKLQVFGDNSDRGQNYLEVSLVTKIPRSMYCFLRVSAWSWQCSANRSWRSPLEIQSAKKVFTCMIFSSKMADMSWIYCRISTYLLAISKSSLMSSSQKLNTWIIIKSAFCKSMYRKAMHLLQLVCQDRSIFEKITNLFDKWNHSQALRVVAVQSGASCAGDTSGRASVSNSSALPVMSDTSGGSSPCASWAPRTASGARGWWSGCEGGVNRAPFDVGVGDWCRGWVLFNISWRTGGCWARSSSHAWCACLLSWWVRGIKPQHLRGVVIPDGHNENHSLF